MDTSFISTEILFACLGILAALIRYATYFWLVFKKEARPHVFSWFVWALIVGIGAFVQTKIGGGPSVWVLWMVCATCLLMSLIALKYGEKHITRGDWISFSMALVAIPVWQMSQNPMLTFGILIFIDLCSFYPTWRKMWVDPWSEPVSGFAWSGLRYFFALLAVPEPGLMTLIYPFWLMIGDWGSGVYGYFRRRTLKIKPLN